MHPCTQPVWPTLHHPPHPTPAPPQVDPASKVLTSPAPASEGDAAWRMVYATVASLAVVASFLGLGFCYVFGRKHSEYFASHSEYETLKVCARACARVRACVC